MEHSSIPIKKRRPAPASQIVIARTPPRPISNVLGQRFHVVAPTTFLTNLHQSHRGVMEELAREQNLRVDFLPALHASGLPKADTYAVHVLTPGYDREFVLSELHARIIANWTAQHIGNDVTGA